ncbi:MAG: TerB N-terminal domain-containing protein [Clostridia bacterium]|nr:TerB N-terminal domain-containing protein [Clostridia bacterium]
MNEKFGLTGPGHSRGDPVELRETVEDGEPKLNLFPIRGIKRSSQGKAAVSDPLYSYDPGLPLINSVSVYRWGTEYSYYDGFLSAAERLKNLTSDCESYVPFFSYMPQYSQMNAEQLGYYLKLRSEISEGRFPRADYGYLLLLIYETINLAGVSDCRGTDIPPESALDILINIWTGYRDENPRLDDQLSEWVCDFCLIHRLRPPLERIRSFVRDAVRNSSLKEFYAEPSDECILPFLLDFVSGYDYRKSRFATDEASRALFEKHIPAAVSAVISSVEGQGSTLGRLEARTVTRDAYLGAVCVPSVKKKISVSYKSFTASYEAKMTVSLLVKHSENRLRAMLGVKSRMSVSGLPDRIKKLADDYFRRLPGNAVSRRQSVESSVAAEPEWEKYYEPEKTEMSFERAREIEQSSWETTEKLISAFGDGLPDGDARRPAAGEDGEPHAGAAGEAAPDPGEGRPQTGDAAKEDLPAGEAPADEERTRNSGGSTDDDAHCSPAEDAFAAESMPGPTDIPECPEGYGITGGPSAPWPEAYSGFVSALLKNDRKAAAAEAKRLGRPAEIIVEEINSSAYELFGDILIEETDGGLEIIPDYAEEAARLAGEA